MDRPAMVAPCTFAGSAERGSMSERDRLEDRWSGSPAVPGDTLLTEAAYRVDPSPRDLPNNDEPIETGLCTPDLTGPSQELSDSGAAVWQGE